MIQKRVALLDAEKVGAGVTVFVAIKTNQHNREWLDHFASSVEDMPEILDFYRMSGEIDYLLRVVVSDIAAFDDFYQRLISRVPLSDVTSSFAMEKIKHTTALPIATTELSIWATDRTHALQNLQSIELLATQLIGSK